HRRPPVCSRLDCRPQGRRTDHAGAECGPVPLGSWDRRTCVHPLARPGRGHYQRFVSRRRRYQGPSAGLMDAEIIAVGSEMLTPQSVDTNAVYLTAELNNLGVEVVMKSVFGDNRDRLADAIRRAISRHEILILSGGLGPTEDDLTREAVAQALDRKLVFHPDIAEALEQRFAAAKRKMAEVNKRQAFVIEGAAVLPNDRGTAPGQWVEDSGAVVML